MPSVQIVVNPNSSYKSNNELTVEAAHRPLALEASIDSSKGESNEIVRALRAHHLELITAVMTTTSAAVVTRIVTVSVTTINSTTTGSDIATDVPATETIVEVAKTTSRLTRGRIRAPAAMV